MLHFFNFIPRVSLFLFFKSQNLLFPSPTPFCLLLPFLFHFIFDFFPLLAWFSSLILIIYSPSILSKTFFPFRYFIIFFLSFFLLIPFISLLIFPHLSFILQGWMFFFNFLPIFYFFKCHTLPFCYSIFPSSIPFLFMM